jgi:hypothetical protein
MFTRTLGIATLALAAAAAPARADIMHWFWEVEVNGEAVDATRPIGVVPGDQVDIQLRAQFDPYRDGFAAAEFGIATGGQFFECGTVNIDLSDGYGLNPYLAWQSGLPGEFADADGDGITDTIDDIVPLQFHPDWGYAFDDSNPVDVYRIGWEVQSSVRAPFTLNHQPTLSGRFYSGVWVDPYTPLDYTPSSDQLMFVPTAGSSVVLVIAMAAVSRRPRVAGMQ